MTEDKIKPFNENGQVLTLIGTTGSITIENLADVIVMYGNMDLRKDNLSLKNAIALRNFFNVVIDDLENHKDLPDHAVKVIEEGGEINNPFE